jgi:AcrR family transcriptional regulator
MVQAAIEAVRLHGPTVSVADIAKQAGITKPVLYRHFDDRADLHRAVGQEAANMLMARMEPVLERELEPVELIRAGVDAFLAGIEDEPQLWAFVTRPGDHPQDEIVDDVKQTIANLLALVIGERLRAAKLDSGGAEAWAIGLVGMVQSAGGWWLERRTMSRAALTDYLTALIWNGVAGTLATAATPLQLVPRTHQGEA